MPGGNKTGGLVSKSLHLESLARKDEPIKKKSRPYSNNEHFRS